ncbi:MAG: transglycosylase SLT domain-containing protein [Byssovorax sp.]
MHTRLALPLLALTLAQGAVFSACAERRVPAPPPAGTPPTLEAQAPATAEAAASSVPEAASATAGASWIEAVRLERWREAAPLIDALPDAERARPAVRYVRARAALATGDHARAASLLAGLENELPLLSADVIRYRAEAALEAGPFAEAAAYFAKSTRPRDLAKAALAFDRAGDAASARRYADQSVAAAQKAKGARDEPFTRMARARLHQAHGEQAAAEIDLRWVAVRAPSSAEGKEAVAALDAMKKTLTSTERSQAIDSLVESGSPDAASEIEKLGKEQGAARADLPHARAQALYKARNYPEAAKAWREAAKAPGKPGHEAEELFYAARSLARSDSDEEAIKTYQEVAAKYPRTVWAERAQILAARLYLQNGKFKEAAKSYTAYLSVRKKGGQRADAEYERALAWLSSGAVDQAKKSFADQARRAGGDEADKLRELEGVAAFRAGDAKTAIALWTEIAKNEPFSWAAQMARARLVAAGAPLPPLIEPAAEQPASKLVPRLPPAAELLRAVGLDGDAESYLATSEREISQTYGGREGEALCGLYGQLSRGKRRYKVAVNAVSAAVLRRAPSEAERWAWECLYPQPFGEGVRSLEAQHGLPRGLLHALMRQESAFDPAIVSPASAVGLMQLMPATAKQAAAEAAIEMDANDLTRPDANLKLGAFYLTKLLKMFQNHVVLAAAAYNAGPRAVSHWVEAGADNDLDLWVARIPFDETRNYVARVSQNLSRYQWLSGGDQAVTLLSLDLPAGAKATPDAY